jgi:hypothetical protein
MPFHGYSHTLAVERLRCLWSAWANLTSAMKVMVRHPLLPVDEEERIGIKNAVEIRSVSSKAVRNVRQYVGTKGSPTIVKPGGSYA